MLHVYGTLRPNLNGWDRKHKIGRTEKLYKFQQYID